MRSISTTWVRTWAYWTAYEFACRLGYHHLSTIALKRMGWMAEQAQDPLMSALRNRHRSAMLLRQGKHDLALRNLCQSGRMTWNGDDYQARFDHIAAEGGDVHGEATLVRSFGPATVLDAGCGTGRVAIELARHGIAVTGVDIDESMLATARRLAPEISWLRHDLTDLDLGLLFDIVVMAGNVPLFTPPGTEPALVSGVAGHVRPGGRLIAGFSLDRGYSLADYDTHCRTAGLTLEARYATWARAPYTGGEYAVSVHRRP